MREAIRDDMLYIKLHSGGGLRLKSLLNGGDSNKWKKCSVVLFYEEGAYWLSVFTEKAALVAFFATDTLPAPPLSQESSRKLREVLRTGKPSNLEEQMRGVQHLIAIADITTLESSSEPSKDKDLADMLYCLTISYTTERAQRLKLASEHESGIAAWIAAIDKYRNSAPVTLKNEIYGVCFKDFHVQLVEVPSTCTRLSLRVGGRYRLRVSDDKIELLAMPVTGQVASPNVLVDWSFKQIRGFIETANERTDEFGFEAGSQSATGVGFVRFVTPDAPKLMQLVLQNVAKLRNSMRSAPPANLLGNTQSFRNSAPPEPAPEPPLRDTLVRGNTPTSSPSPINSASRSHSPSASSIQQQVLEDQVRFQPVTSESLANAPANLVASNVPNTNVGQPLPLPPRGVRPSLGTPTSQPVRVELSTSSISPPDQVCNPRISSEYEIPNVPDSNVGQTSTLPSRGVQASLANAAAQSSLRRMQSEAAVEPSSTSTSPNQVNSGDSRVSNEYETPDVPHSNVDQISTLPRSVQASLASAATQSSLRRMQSEAAVEPSSTSISPPEQVGNSRISNEYETPNVPDSNVAQLSTLPSRGVQATLASEAAQFSQRSIRKQSAEAAVRPPVSPANSRHVLTHTLSQDSNAKSIVPGKDKDNDDPVGSSAMSGNTKPDSARTKLAGNVFTNLERTLTAALRSRQQLEAKYVAKRAPSPESALQPQHNDVDLYESLDSLPQQPAYVTFADDPALIQPAVVSPSYETYGLVQPTPTVGPSTTISQNILYESSSHPTSHSHRASNSESSGTTLNKAVLVSKTSITPRTSDSSIESTAMRSRFTSETSRSIGNNHELSEKRDEAARAVESNVPSATGLNVRQIALTLDNSILPNTLRKTSSPVPALPPKPKVSVAARNDAEPPPVPHRPPKMQLPNSP